MKTLITGTAMLICLSVGMVYTINAVTTPDFVPTVGQVATYTPVSVDVGNAPGNGTITLPVVSITAKHTPARVVRQDPSCAFASRELVQGSGSVRGFCTR